MQPAINLCHQSKYNYRAILMGPHLMETTQPSPGLDDKSEYLKVPEQRVLYHAPTKLPYCGNIR
jgi:hypothetical protein